MFKVVLKLIAVFGVMTAVTDASQAAVGTSSCRDIVGAGWDKMPDVADYVRSKPYSEKLGYGSECALGSLVFAQCWLEPKWTVDKAVDALILKAKTGKRLPGTPACGG